MRDGQQGTIVVIQDITDQEREEKQRKEFVANVSHELKTPLTTIKTYSESLLEWGLAEKNDEAVRKDIWRIHDDSLRMERLVEDLLLLSSIDSRGIRIRPELMDLPQLVRQVIDRLQVQAQEKQIVLDSIVLSRIPLVLIDRSAMERVITKPDQQRDQVHPQKAALSRSSSAICSMTSMSRCPTPGLALTRSICPTFSTGSTASI